jgi:uncharacterized protein YjiS (DUF1127 family)
MDQIKNIRFSYQTLSATVPPFTDRATRNGARYRAAERTSASRAQPSAEDFMPAVTSFAPGGATSVARGFKALAGVVAGLARWLKNRAAAAKLARLDDRMLADIGLTRSDLSDAYSQPLWHDPTEILARRAHERRVSRQRRAFDDLRDITRPQAATGSATESQALQYPSADRPTRFLV